MMPTLAPPSVLSAPQRRCQVLLTLFQPGQIATAEMFSALNGVDDTVAREDIVETGLEIHRYHRLSISTGPNGCYRIEGTALNQRLCLYTGSDAACVCVRRSLTSILPPPSKLS